MVTGFALDDVGRHRIDDHHSLIRSARSTGRLVTIVQGNCAPRQASSTAINSEIPRAAKKSTPLRSSKKEFPVTTTSAIQALIGSTLPASMSPLIVRTVARELMCARTVESDALIARETVLRSRQAVHNNHEWARFLMEVRPLLPRLRCGAGIQGRVDVATCARRERAGGQ